MQYQPVGSKVAFRDTRSLVIILARVREKLDGRYYKTMIVIKTARRDVNER